MNVHLEQRLQNKPYLIDAIIGNSHWLSSLGANGRMYRAWWPHIDTPQLIDAVRVGLVTEEQGKVHWFENEAAGWQHEAQYVAGSNIFHVRASSAQHPIVVDSLHFAVPEKDLIVREYTLTNTGSSPLSVSLILYSSMQIDENPLYQTTMFEPAVDALVHFKKQYYLAWAGDQPCAKFQAGLSFEAASEGLQALRGVEIDMQSGGACAWSVGTIAPGESVVLPLYLAAGHTLEQVLRNVEEARTKTSDQWYEETIVYWQQYLAQAAPCPLQDPAVCELYERSLLMFSLMSDGKTGSIIAAPEFDEYFTVCGGYGYCWGRDAAFITTALDRAGLTHLTDKFYDWALTAQSPDGSWQQRHYHDGSLAPSWGLQIDEGASILWGMYQHYLHRPSAGFLRKVWPAVRLGADFLMNFLDEETGLPQPSRDLWEEREAIHTYSAAAVYGGLTAAAEFAKLNGDAASAARWEEAAMRIKQRLEELCWNEARGCLYRGLRLTVDAAQYEQALAAGASGKIVESDKGYVKHVLDVDPVIDVSLLGVAVPFDCMPAESERMRLTADKVEEALTVPGVGGILRYEGDPYVGGNPWILTTLWLAQYRIRTGQLDEARKLIDWALAHRTRCGLLPEQVDRESGETAWVVPLTWSHAMFVLAVWMLAEAERAG